MTVIGQRSLRDDLIKITERSKLFFIIASVSLWLAFPHSLLSAPTQLPLEWVPIRGAVSYLVRVTDAAGKVVIEKPGAENRTVIALEPGEYIVTIAVINRFRRIASWSDPEPLKVGSAAPVLVVNSAEPSVLKPGQGDQKITILGENLSEKTDVKVSSPTASIPVTKVESAQINSIEATLNTRNAPPGQYDITLRNPLFAPVIRPGALTLPGTPANADAKKEQPGSSPSRRFCGACWENVYRSAILPGWGHLHAGEKKTGFIYEGLFFGSAAVFLLMSNHVSNDRHNYERQATLDFNLLFLTGRHDTLSLAYAYWSEKRGFANYSAQAKEANALLPFMGLLYIGQLVHAYFSGQRVTSLLPRPPRIAGQVFVLTGSEGTARGQRVSAGVEFAY